MDKNQLLFIAAASGALALLVIASAAAGASTTPLYTFRMEQASCKKNFLPTEKNGFTYVTEKGVTLDYGSTQYCERCYFLLWIFS